MKQKVKMPFEPFITIEQILAYDAERQANPTESRLINYMMYAIQKFHLKSAKAVAECLELTQAQLSRTVEVVTGLTFNEIHEAWLHHKVAQLQAEHPEWNTDELASALGYSDRSGLWNIMHRNVRKEQYREFKEYWRKRRECQRTGSTTT